MEHIDERIVKLIKDQEALGGIDTRKLEPGTKIEVVTRNSLYEFEITDRPGYVLAIGGKRLPEEKLIYLTGSTFGGSMLKIGWIGHGMYIEMQIDDKTVVTSSVRKAAVRKGDWVYDLEWPS